jgi:hypothetical protein
MMILLGHKKTLKWCDDYTRTYKCNDNFTIPRSTKVCLSRSVTPENLTSIDVLTDLVHSKGMVCTLGGQTFEPYLCRRRRRLIGVEEIRNQFMLV